MSVDLSNTQALKDILRSFRPVGNSGSDILLCIYGINLVERQNRDFVKRSSGRGSK